MAVGCMGFAGVCGKAFAGCVGSRSDLGRVLQIEVRGFLVGMSYIRVDPYFWGLGFRSP